MPKAAQRDPVPGSGWTVYDGARTAFVDVAPVPMAPPRRGAAATARRLLDAGEQAVFVDQSGRRRRLLRWCAALVSMACVGFAVLLTLSVADGTSTAPSTTIPASAPARLASTGTPAAGAVAR